MNPTVNDVQLYEPVLTRSLIAYANGDERFVGERVFPNVPVDKDSGSYPIFTKGFWLSDEFGRRAPGNPYAEGDFGVSSGTYTTEQWALAHIIPDERRRNSQLPVDLEDAGLRWLAQKLNIKKERLFAAAAMKTGVWATDGSVGNGKWSAANSTPVTDITTGKRTISQSTGVYPTKLIMGEIVRDRLVVHADLLDRIKYTQQAGIRTIEAALSAIFDIPVFVGSAIYNSANEGQTATIAPIMDDDILLVYTPDAPGLWVPSAGYMLSWEGGGGDGQVMPLERVPLHDADALKAKAQFVFKITATDVGYFMADVVD